MIKKSLTLNFRPKNLTEFIGQEHLLAEDQPLFRLMNQKSKISFILWGPPGSGKTTFARIYAKSLNINFYELSAVDASKKDIQLLLKEPGEKILFLDEIHRFNKAQQDFLLPLIEEGELLLIGATTENPSFEIISPLLSRLQIFVFEPLSTVEISQIIKNTKLKIAEEDLDWLSRYSVGDARRALNLLEATINLYGEINQINFKKILNNHHILAYDKKGDWHYSLISAFIKSMRAGQVDATLYYLARMIEAGEDPNFIARRMIIFASEDIGLSQPTALVVANGVFRAIEVVGLPEAGLNLAHGACYLARAQKDRRVYDAWQASIEDVKRYGNLSVPNKIKNPTNKLEKEMGYGDNYECYDQESYLPKELKNKKYFKE